MLSELALDLDLNKVGKDVKIQLAKPNKQILKNIKEITSAELEDVEINGLAILNFKIPHKVQRRIDVSEDIETIDNPDIKMIKEEMLIKLTWYNKQRVNWFRIAEIKKTDSQESVNMEVRAEALPSELKSTNVYYDDNPLNIQEYFAKALEQTAWGVGHISDKLKDTYRSFDDSKKTRYEAIQNGIETYGAVADWDEENRILNLLSISDIRVFRGIVLKKENYMSSLEIESTSEDIVTRMYAYGNEELGIEKQNPTGMPYLEDYSYFIAPFERDENKNVLQHSNYMSDELCHALLDLIELQKEYNPRIKQLQTLINQAIKDLSKAMLEKVELEGEVITIEALLDTAKSTNDKPLIAQREKELSLKKKELADKIAQIEDIKKSIELWEKTIKSYQELISTSSFSPNLVKELSLFIYDKEFRDDRYIDDKDLYEASVKEFEKYQQPVRKFNVELASFVNSIDGQRVKDRLKIGEEVMIKSNNLKTQYKSIILGYSVYFLDGTYTLKISDSLDDIDAMDKLATLIYKADSSSTILNNNKYKWDNVSIIKDEVEKWRTQEIDTVNKRIIAGANESITIDNYGIQAMNPDFPNERIIIQSGVMALSKDGGKTWSTSITPDGVIAETIIGKIIAGNNLIITNENGSFVIDSTGLNVDMDSIHIMSGQSGTKEDLVQLWNNLLLTYDEISDDSKVNEYEKNQLEKQWTKISNIHSSMIQSFEKGWKQQASKNPIVEGEEKKEIAKPIEYNQYVKAYEDLNKYLNTTKQTDGFALLDKKNRKETTDINHTEFQNYFKEYEMKKQAFESIISLEFTKASIEVLESGISLNYTRNKEIVTQLNLSEEGIKIDGKLLEINADTEFNANLTMNAGVIQDKNKDIVIDLNKGEITLNKPIKIGTGSNIATKDDVEKAQIKAYTMVLTNDMALIPTDSSGANGNFTTAVTTAMVYKGTVEETNSWKYEVSVSSGITGKLVGSKYTVSNMTKDNGTVTITAKKDDLTLSKVFQLSKVKAGSDGQKGDTGLVKMLTLSADSYIMTFTGTAPMPSKQSITVKADVVGLSGALKWTVFPYINGVSQAPIVKTPNGNSIIITQDDLKGNIDTMKIIASCDGFEDTLSIVKIKNGDGIVNAKVEYQLGDSGTVRPTGSWSTSMPSVVKGKYLWSRTTSTYSNGTNVETFSVSYLPLDGQQGQQGASGTGILSTKVEYQTHLSGVTAPTGTWLSSIPNTPKGAFLWTRTTIKYTNNTESVSYSTSYFAVDGEKGEAPVTGFLTNESITLGADQSGIVSDYTGANGIFEVYDGLKKVTGKSVIYSISNKSNCEATINSSGEYKLTRMDVGATVLNGFVEFKANYNDIILTKKVSISKAVQGKQGQQGANGADGAKGDSATAYWVTPTVNVLSTTASGLINPQAVGFNAYSKTGTQNVVAFKGVFEIDTSTNGTSYTNAYRSTTLEASKTYTVSKGTKFVRVKLYDTTSRTNLLDEQTLPVLDTNGDLYQAWANSADGTKDFTRNPDSVSTRNDKIEIPKNYATSSINSNITKSFDKKINYTNVVIKHMVGNEVLEVINEPHEIGKTDEFSSKTYSGYVLDDKPSKSYYISQGLVVTFKYLSTYKPPATSGSSVPQDKNLLVDDGTTSTINITTPQFKEYNIWKFKNRSLADLEPGVSDGTEYTISFMVDEIPSGSTYFMLTAEGGTYLTEWISIADLKVGQRYVAKFKYKFEYMYASGTKSMGITVSGLPADSVIKLSKPFLIKSSEYSSINFGGSSSEVPKPPVITTKTTTIPMPQQEEIPNKIRIESIVATDDVLGKEVNISTHLESTRQSKLVIGIVNQSNDETLIETNSVTNGYVSKTLTIPYSTKLINLYVGNSEEGEENSVKYRETQMTIGSSRMSWIDPRVADIMPPTTTDIKSSYLYVGYSTKDSTDPKDYRWSANGGDVDMYKAWSNSSNGFINFTRNNPSENLLLNSRTIKPSSNDSSQYPMSATLMTEEESQFYRAKRTGSMTNKMFSIYTAINPSNIVRLEDIVGMTVTISGEFRASHEVQMSLMARYGDSTGNKTFKDDTKMVTVGTNWTAISTTIDNFPDVKNFIRFTPSMVKSGTFNTINLADFYLDSRNFKIEVGKFSAYTTPSSEDLANSVMKYVGFGVKDSDNPSDYEWIDSVEYVNILTEMNMDNIKHTADNALNLSENAVKKEEFYSWLEQDYENQISTIKDISDSNKKDLLSLNSRTTIIEGNYNDMKVKWNFIDQSISFSEEGMFISNQKSKMAIQVSSDKIVFWDNNVDVAFITGEMLNITRGVFLESATIGNHVITKFSETSPVTLVRYIGKL